MNWILIIITAVYAFLTFLILKESQRNRKDSFIPIVVVIFKGYKIIITNKGKCILQNLRIEPSNSDIVIGNANLCSGESRAIDIPRINYLEIVYEDIFNRKCVTKVWVQRKAYQFVPPK